MKRIINGKLYNTRTATELGSYWNHLPSNDFRHLEETLYRSPKGALFLAGSGGPMTEYAEGDGNTTWGSSRIIPLTIEEAFEWAEAHLTTEELLAIDEFKSLITEA